MNRLDETPRPALRLVPTAEQRAELERRAFAYRTTPEVVARFLIGQRLLEQRRRREAA